MKVLPILLVLLLITGGIVKCGHSIYSAVENFPEEAKKENLYRRYEVLIRALDTAIDTNNTKFSLAASLEKIDYPPEIVLVALTEKNADPLTIRSNLRNSNPTSTHSFIMNGTGYGTVNGQSVWIIDHPLNKCGYDTIKVYLRREDT